MPTNAPTWDETVEEKTPAWNDTQPDLSRVKPSADQEVYLKTGLTDPSRAGESDFTTAIGSDPLGFAKSIPQDIARGVENAGAALLNVPAAMYRQATEGTADYPKPIGIIKRDENGQEILTTEPKPMPFQPGQPIVKFRGTQLQPRGNQLQQMIEGLLTPGNIATFPFAATKPAQAYFLTQTAPGTVEAAAKLVAPGTPPQDRREAATDLLINGIMTHALAKGLISNHQLSTPEPSTETEYARQESEPTEIHGNVRPQPQPIEPEMPAPESGRGIQPQTAGRLPPGPGEETQSPPRDLPLTPMPGERLVTIQKSDGTTYQASYGDQVWPGAGPSGEDVPMIARPLGNEWNHGILHPDEKIVEDPGAPASGTARPTEPAPDSTPLESVIYQDGPADRTTGGIPPNTKVIHYGPKGEEVIYRRTDQKDSKGRTIFKAEPSASPRLSGETPPEPIKSTGPTVPTAGEKPPLEEIGDRPISSVEQFIKVPETDPGDLKKTINDLHTTRDTLRSQQADAAKQMETLAKTVTYQTGPRYQRGQIKPSAPKGAVRTYNAIRQKWSELGTAANAIEEQLRKTGQPVEIFKLQQRVNNSSLPLMARLMARKELFFAEGKTPPDDLGLAIRAESDRIVRERYPDATEAELRKLEHAVTREGSTGGNFKHAWELDPELNLSNQRRKEIPDTFLTKSGVSGSELSESLQAEIAKYRPTGTELSRAKTDELISRIKQETESIVAKRQAESAAAAQAAVDMEKKFTTVIETERVISGKAAKEKLVGALETALEKAPDEAAGRATVSIHIPGDGNFKILNTKEQIAHVLGEARKLETSKGGKWHSPYSKPSGKLSAQDDAVRAIQIYGTPGKAFQTLKKQVGMAKELELTPEQTERLGKVVETLENTVRDKWKTARRTLQQAEDREEFLIKQFGAKSKQVTENRKNIEAFKRGEATERVAMERELGESAIPNPQSEIGKTSASRIPRPGGRTAGANPFEMDSGDLADLLEERYGTAGATGVPGQVGRSGQFTFPNYDAFAKWMDERYTERDHEGMRLAFAEADTQSKIRYIKENRGADAHKKAWVTNLATGADLPKEDGPRPRTTPRPGPGRSAGGSPASPPSRPSEPPPPPRDPTHHRKFDVTALVQLFRQFAQHPTMNSRLRRAYGQFVHSTKAVELKNRLFWDTKLAERVLGHEIGHFIDFAVQIVGKHKQFGRRIRPLFSFKNDLGLKQDLRNQARDLSRDWRGSFQNGDRYRDTTEELFADFMSAMFNQPEWVNQKYPGLYDSFQHLLDGKPQFKSAYREIETWLQGDTVPRELMDQDKKAVEKTVDILTTEDKKMRSSFRDRLTFDMVTLWNRAFEKEGKPRLIGTSITEKLEASYMWAAKRVALWHDDFVKTVQPELDKVSADPIEARARLLSYSKAVRTIGERRAAGLWIERNPVEARELLTSILDLDSTLHYKFAADLQRATNDQLYDLAASIFREMHDRGVKYVDRMARRIDRMGLGIAGQDALMAFNVRGKLLNPGGLTVETAGKVLAELQDQLGPDKFRALETAAGNLRDLMHSVQVEMHNAGLISDKTWNELILPNKDNYLPYAVLDYFDGRVRAGVMPQRGTARDVADIAAATELKVSSAYLWLQKQRQVQLLKEAYARGGSPLTIGDELERAADLERLQAQHKNDDVSRAVLWVNGKPHLMEFPGDPGKLLQDAMNLPEFYNHIEWLHTASKVSHQVMQLFTQLSPRFLLYRNVLRGFRTAGLKVGYLEAAKQMRPENFRRNFALAQNYAQAAFGGEMLPEVRSMIASDALPPPRVALGSVVDLPNMRELLVRGALPVFQAQKLRPDVPAETGPLMDKARQAKNVTDKIFSGYEAFEKIYNYQAALAKGLTPETASAIAKRGGIPNPGVVGKWSSAAEIFFPWTRVRIQGMRSSYDLVRDPRFRKGFLARFALTEAAPRIAKVALGIGLAHKLITWATGGKPDDKDDGVMAEVFKRISPYKMALDDVVPTMLYDPRTGKYHYFWEYKKGAEIPKHFEVVSVRIPASEEGQTWGTMLYNAMISAPGADEKLSRPGEGIVENMGNWALNYLTPSPSPMLQTANDLKEMVLRGHNPEDPFRGQPAANPQLFEAGGKDRAQAIFGYTLNQLGGPGELGGVIAANAGVLDDRALDSLKSRLSSDKRTWTEKIPFLGAAVSHDNYAEYRTEKEAQLADQQLRAKARLIMSPGVRDLYDFYYLNQARQKQLTGAEKSQFEASKHFVDKIWGNLTVKGKPNPDSYFSKAAHAVGPDGSSQAKATIKRDLDHAAAIDIVQFQHARTR